MFENISERISESEEEVEAEVTLATFSFGLYILVNYYVPEFSDTLRKNLLPDYLRSLYANYLDKSCSKFLKITFLNYFR